MRYLGIDYGFKRVGVSISDEEGIFAYPLVVLENNTDLAEEIKNICAEKNVDEIVVGNSLDYNMKENKIMSEMKPFVEKLKEKTELKIKMHPEFLTSAEAERIQGKIPMLDASAAAIILQSYLNTEKLKEK